MIIIIDGYNLLKQLYRHREITAQERRNCVEKIGDYARIKRHSIVVVFDGGPYMWPHKEKICTVTVVYVGMRDSADDYIMDYVIQHARKDVLVVTSDNAIQKVANEHDIPSLGSEDFWSFVTDVFQIRTQQVPEKFASTDAVKTTEEENPELDQLFAEYKNSVPIKSNDYICAEREKRRSTVAKKDRRLMSIIRKL